MIHLSLSSTAPMVGTVQLSSHYGASQVIVVRTHTPPGFKIRQMVSMYSMTLGAVSKKKQVTNTSHALGEFPTISIHSPCACGESSGTTYFG